MFLGDYPYENYFNFLIVSVKMKSYKSINRLRIFRKLIFIFVVMKISTLNNKEQIYQSEKKIKIIISIFHVISIM